MRDFVHIHVHTKYSERDGVPSPGAYVNKVIEQSDKMDNTIDTKALAITEHGNLYSFAEHYLSCKKKKIKPIIGMESYHCINRSIDNKPRYHLVLLAKNKKGLQNLLKISSIAGMHKEHGKQKDFPKNDEIDFAALGEGIIASTACIAGLIPRLILDNKYIEAKQKAIEYNNYFDEFYLEVQPHNIPEQAIVNNALVTMSKETGIPLLITDDAHYLDKADQKYHDILKQMDHLNPFTITADLKDSDEIEQYCIDNSIPLEAMDNSVKIANSIDEFDIFPTSKNGMFPTFPCPKGYDEDSYLRKIAVEMFMEKCKEKRIDNFKLRLKQLMYELDVITSMGYSGYFLIIWDWFNWCRANGILLGKGRGCFLPETKVLLSDGNYKNIEDFSINDEVITHLGNVKKVYDTPSYDCDEDITVLKASNDFLKLTNDHKVFSMKTSPCQAEYSDGYIKPVVCTADCNKYRTRHCKKYVFENYKLGWNEASTLSKNDFIVYPRNKAKARTVKYDLINYLPLIDKYSYDNEYIYIYNRNINRYILFNKDLAQLLGYYISIGTIIRERIQTTPVTMTGKTKYTFRFDFRNGDSSEEIILLFKKIFGVMPNKIEKNSDYMILEFKDYIIPRFIYNITGFSNKLIPESIVKYGRNNLVQTLISYMFKGYGSKADIENDVKFRIRYTAHSYSSAYQLRMLLARFGYWGYIRKRNVKKNSIDKHYILGLHGKQLLKWNKDFSDYELDMAKKDNYNYHRNDFIVDDDYIYIKIKSTYKKHYKGKVYDLSVKDDTSYVANGVTVHNSAAGSLLCYSLGITSIDPITNHFIFERFLNPERKSEPDCDSDISKVDRSDGIKYLENKYGKAFVSQIITFSEYKLKNTIKGSMSAYGYPYEEANALTKIIPNLLNGKEITLHYIEDIHNNPLKYQDSLSKADFSLMDKVYEELEKLFQKYPKVYDAVKHLAGAISGTGCHAGGVVISGVPITDYVPITAGRESTVLPLIQLDMDNAHEFGILKIDVLGLNTLSQLDLAMKISKLDYDWFDNEDFSDPKVYELIRKGFTTDMFQSASPSATRMLKDFTSDCFEDLVAVNAGNRPGPLTKDKTTGKSMVEMYIENKAYFKKTGKIPSVHPKIDNVLKETYGCFFYQEQIMEVAMIMAGYTRGGSDSRIRKPMCKKLVDLMPEIRNEFVYGKKSIYKYDDELKKDVYDKISDEDSEWCKGAINRGFTEEFANHIFDTFAAFAAYCFNKAHAGAYGTLMYKTAWMWTYYPVEYAVACMTECDDNDKITATLAQCKRLGIKILPPDINTSNDGFSVEVCSDGTKAIRYGMKAIKGVGDNALQYIKKLRNVKGTFNSLEDFYNSTHDEQYRKLYDDGTMVDKKGNRKNKNNPIDKRSLEPLIKSGAFDFDNENRYLLLNEMYELRKDKKAEIYDEKEYTRAVKLNLEKEHLGAYISEHPLDIFPYTDLGLLSTGDKAEIAGVVTNVYKKKTKTKKDFATVMFEAKDGLIHKAMLFGGSYTKYMPKIKKGEISIFYGEYNASFSNINCDKIRKVVKKSKVQETALDSEDEKEELIKDNNSIPVREDDNSDIDLLFKM